MVTFKRSARAAFGLAILLALSGCLGPSTPSPTTTTTSSTSSSASASPTASASPSPSSTSTSQPPQQVAPLTVYYVAMGDNGASGPMIGCGDSLVATQTAPTSFTDKVAASIRALLANRSRTIGQSGLVNVLYQSTLNYAGESFDGTTVTVYLTGQFMLAGECDDPRAKAQLENTAMTAAGAKQAAVIINGQPIDQALSLK